MTIAQLLQVELGTCILERFPDTEVNVRLEEPVRGRRVFIVQSSCPPVDQHLMEVFAIADASRRAAASSITWIAPYFGYARSDKRRGRRAAMMGRLVADFTERAGIDDLIATGGTIRNAIETLIQAGATHRFLIAASHAVFTPEARKTLNHPSIRKIIVTDSIPLAPNDWPQVEVISLGSILAGAIRRSMTGESMMTLCEEQ